MHNYSTHDKKQATMHKYLALLYHTKVWLSSNEIKLQKMQIIFSAPKKNADNSFLGELPAVSRHDSAMNLR